MPRSFPATLVEVKLNPSSKVPLYRQLFDQVRASIIRGELKAGTRLPATRDLVSRLDCSRSTVLLVFEMLAAEGYVQTRQGSGTYVNHLVPDDLLLSSLQDTKSVAKQAPPRISDLSERVKSVPVSQVLLPHSGVIFPDIREFPYDLWSRIFRQVWKAPAPNAVNDPFGHMPLRQAIAEYLANVRGVKCDPRQIVITSGASHALSLLFNFLLNPGDAVWIEDPSPPWIAAKAVACDARPVFVPVDKEGLDVSAGEAIASKARLAFVTPSHQAPLGEVLSLRRRVALLDWANTNDSWIIEDDYDSEFRYSGRPLPTLHSLDDRSRVFYVATFSKILLPSLRLGYIVVPPQFVESFSRVRALLDRYTAEPMQPVLAHFMSEGHFASHIRRVRILYQSRQETLLQEAQVELDGLIYFTGSEAGLHVIVKPDKKVAERLDTTELADLASSAGIAMSPLSNYTRDHDPDNRLIFGYARFTSGELKFGVRRLAELLKKRLAPE